jgi:hypothetical protein
MNDSGPTGWKRLLTEPRALAGDLGRDAAEVWQRPEDRRALKVLLTSAVLLVVFAIWGRPNFLKAHLIPVGSWIGVDAASEYYPTLPYVYWGLSSLVVRVLIPVLVIVLWIGDRPADFGYRLRGVTRHAWLYLLMFLVMIPVLVAASFAPAFQAKYPMYDQASLGWTHFVLWELAYGVQFLGVEGFFRGFMTFGLYPRFGYLSLFIMVIPYALVHVGKPPIEVFMAIPAGLALGYVALKTRSWVFGALLHWAVGITMDTLAIWHSGGFGP